MKRTWIVALTLGLLLAATAVAQDKEKGEVSTSIGSLKVYGTFKVGFNYYIGDETAAWDDFGWGVIDPVDQVIDRYTRRPGVVVKDRETMTDFVINFFGFGLSGWVLDQRITYNVGIFAVDRAVSVNGLYQYYFDSQDGYESYYEAAPITSYGKTTMIDLIDLKLGFHYIPFTAIYLGRLLPAFTYSNSLPVGQFKTIDEPLMNRYVMNRARQLGANINLVTDYLDAHLGAYNGRQFFPTLKLVSADSAEKKTGKTYNYTGYIPADASDPMGNTSWGDQNTGKDVHFSLIGKPLTGLKIRAGLWYGLPLDYLRKDKHGENIEHNASVLFVNGGVDYLADFGLTVVADVLWGDYKWDKKSAPATRAAGGPDSRTNAAMPDDYTGTTFDEGKAWSYELSTFSGYGMLGYNFGPVFQVPIELLVRYDYWDPDMLNDASKHKFSEDDVMTDIVGGVNYYIKGYYAMVSLNYVHHSEAWKDVYQKDYERADAGYDTPGTQEGIANDELKFQFQVNF
jgi:hypothetical protein